MGPGEGFPAEYVHPRSLSDGWMAPSLRAIIQSGDGGSRKAGQSRCECRQSPSNRDSPQSLGAPHGFSGSPAPAGPGREPRGSQAGGRRRHVRRPGPRDPAARPPAPPPAPPLRPPLAGGSRAPTPQRSRRLGLAGRRAAAAGLPGTPAGRGGWARARARGGPFPSLRLPSGPGRRAAFLLRAPPGLGPQAPGPSGAAARRVMGRPAPRR